MVLWKVYVILGCAAVSALVTGGWVLGDRWLAKKTYTKQALSMARQIVDEFEERADLFSTDDPNAMIQVHRVERWNSEEKETYALTVRGMDYVRANGDGSAIRARIRGPWLGFLGTAGYATHSVMIVFCFFGIWLTLSLLTFKTQLGNKEYWIKKRVKRWIMKTADVIRQLGFQLKDLVGNARDLVVAAARSKEALEKVGQSMGDRMDSLDSSSEKLENLTKITKEARELSDQIKSSLRSFGEDGKELSGAADQLYALIDRIEKARSECEADVEKVRKNLQPWVAGVREAQTAYQGLFLSRDDLDRSITGATHALSTHVNSVSQLKNNFERDFERTRTRRKRTAER